MYITLVCILSKLKLCFAEVSDLVNLACLDAGLVMCDNFVATYANQ